MDANETKQRSRREFLEIAGAVAVGMTLDSIPLMARVAASATGSGMKIGVIGSGRIGGTLGTLWVKAGHEVMFSARNLDPVQKLVAGLGPRVHTGTPKEAAVFGDVILISVPYGALPQLGRDLASDLKGKVVLDTCNPSPGRDGDMAVAARAKGTGVASAEYLPGVRLVRAFNTVPSAALRSEAHRAGDKVAVPLAADDEAALKIAIQLVQDAGFEPVVVGPLARAKEFDTGTPVYGKALMAAELRRGLGLSS
jgi:8-hydroxy-5-deazaflavin:NADPH oxidoreductase